MDSTVSNDKCSAIIANEISQKLDNGFNQSVTVFGQRGCGATSLLFGLHSENQSDHCCHGVFGTLIANLLRKTGKSVKLCIILILFEIENGFNFLCLKIT